MDKKINWSYVAGYFDGEASLLLGVCHDKRDGIWHSRVDNWGIVPCLCVTSFDREVLANIKLFIESQNFKVYKLETKTQRPNQTDNASRLNIFGWDNVKAVCRHLIPVSFAKKEQYILFLKLHALWEKRPFLPNNPYHKRSWTKQTFIEAMGIVDEINSHKSRKRGKMNKAFFVSLWG